MCSACGTKSSLYIWVGTQPTIANKAIGNHTLVMENFGSYGLYVLAGEVAVLLKLFLIKPKVLLEEPAGD